MGKGKFNFRFFKKMNAPMMIVLSFLGFLLISSLILMLPISLNDGIKVSFIDSLFTATTSLCVTGLVSLEAGIGATYSIFGKIYIALLMQIGGLGVTTIASIFFIFFDHKIRASQSNLIKENFSLTSLKGIRTLFLQILLITFIFELVGAFLIFIDFKFIHNFSFLDAFASSLFHSISAYNNAGIDIFGTTSLINYENDAFLSLITALLIILGGIGYFVIIDLGRNKFNFKKIMLHSKIVITFTAFLLIFGTLTIYLTELGNSRTNVSFVGAFFTSVTSRTAGFTLYDLYNFRQTSLYIMIILMFIGASPGGSGGGVKTTTITIFGAYLISMVKGKPTSLFKRNINDDLIKKSFMITMLGLFCFLFGAFLILLFEGENIYLLNGTRIETYQEGCRNFGFFDYTFEAMSAFATVGLSTGITPFLTLGSKIVLIFLMYIGRIGPLTFVLSFKSKKEILYRYVDEDVALG